MKIKIECYGFGVTWAVLSLTLLSFLVKKLRICIHLTPQALSLHIQRNYYV